MHFKLYCFQENTGFRHDASGGSTNLLEAGTGLREACSLATIDPKRSFGWTAAGDFTTEIMLLIEQLMYIHSHWLYLHVLY